MPAKLTAILDYSGEPNGTGTIPVLCYVSDRKVAEQIATHPIYIKNHSANPATGNLKVDIADRELAYFTDLDQFLEWKGELSKENLRKSGLDKLSKEEAEALGLEKA